MRRCYKMARDTRFSFEIRKNNALKGTNLFTKFNLFTVMRKEVHVFISLKITIIRGFINLSMNICLVSASDVMEHFAFPGNIDFAADDQGAF